MRLGPPPAEPEVPGQFWIDFIRDTAPVFRKPTIEQLGEFIAPTFQALIDGAKYVQPRLAEIVDELAPGRDRRGQRRQLPGDHVDRPAMGPAPVVQPGGDQGRGGGAVLVGLSGGRPVGLAGVPRRGRGARTATMWADFDAFCRDAGCGRPRLGRPDGPDFMHESPWLNLYSLSRARPTTSAPYPSARRGTSWTPRSAPPDTTWALPELLAGGATAPSSTSRSGRWARPTSRSCSGWSTCSGATDHRVIVSKGPLADQITLHDNMTGDGFLPQPAILPQVDLVITHGGNNTVIESFHHGKPMVVLPLFWDQVDNAQRVHETGFGRRLATYDFEDAELAARGRCAARRRGAPRADGRGRGADAGDRRDDPGRRPHRAGRGHGRPGDARRRPRVRAWRIVEPHPVSPVPRRNDPGTIRGEICGRAGRRRQRPPTPEDRWPRPVAARATGPALAVARGRRHRWSCSSSRTSCTRAPTPTSCGPGCSR